MATLIQASGRTINLENVTHAIIEREAIAIFPASYFHVRTSGNEAKHAHEQMLRAGFVGDANLLVNPRRIVVIDDAGSVLRLTLEGAAKSLAVSKSFLDLLKSFEDASKATVREPEAKALERELKEVMAELQGTKPDPEKVSSDGNSEVAAQLAAPVKPRKKEAKR